MEDLKQCLYYEDFGDFILCRLCPHMCKISVGRSGLCGVRKNIGNELYAMSYGHISSIALDPIEKKPLRHFLPDSLILSIGSYGCNLRCSFCQNHSISMEKPETRYALPSEIALLAANTIAQGNIGVAYTYNEPFISYEYMLDCAKLCHKQGLKNIIVTNGYINPEPLEEILKYTHAMNIDLKSFTPEFYQHIGGTLDEVKRTIKLSFGKCHLEVTTLIIPHENDSPVEIENLSAWLGSISNEIPLHLTRFHPRYKMLDKESTDLQSIMGLKKIAQKYLKYVY